MFTLICSRYKGHLGLLWHIGTTYSRWTGDAKCCWSGRTNQRRDVMVTWRLHLTTWSWRASREAGPQSMVKRTLQCYEPSAREGSSSTYLERTMSVLNNNEMLTLYFGGKTRGWKRYCRLLDAENLVGRHTQTTITFGIIIIHCNV
jgi:hypothetical protein